MPIHMRMRKLRGPHMKKSMPFEPFRTHTQPVNLAVLQERFDAGAEVTPDLLRAKGLAKRRGIPVKILGQGELSKKRSRHGALEEMHGRGVVGVVEHGGADVGVDFFFYG